MTLAGSPLVRALAEQLQRLASRVGEQRRDPVSIQVNGSCSADSASVLHRRETPHSVFPSQAPAGDPGPGRLLVRSEVPVNQRRVSVGASGDRGLPVKDKVG